jgi:hypothetical protein
MILFYIHGGPGDDNDLFISARSCEEAIDIWREWASIEAGEQPRRVFLVPKLREAPGHHPWHAAPTTPGSRDVGGVGHRALDAEREWDALETIAQAINHGITSYSQGNTKVIIE